MLSKFTPTFSGRNLGDFLIFTLLLAWVVPSAIADEGQLVHIPSAKTPIPSPIEVSDMPQIEAVVAAGSPDLFRYEHRQFVEDFKRDSGTFPLIHSRSDFYHVATDRSFHSFVKWFHQVMWKLDVGYRAEVWDCDDFASSLTLFAEVSAAREYALRHGFAMGLLVVQQKKAWGGAPAMENGLHEVVLAHTAKGFFVIEPQTGSFVPLEKYPNRTTILEVYIN